MNYNIAMNRKEQKKWKKHKSKTTNKDGLPNDGDRSSGNQNITCVINDSRSYTEVDRNVENLMSNEQNEIYIAN